MFKAQASVNCRNVFRVALAAGAMLLIAARATHAGDIEAFTEPYETVNVAAPEIGIIAQIDVKEGELVKAGQMLAKLNTDILEASLRIAEQTRDAVGEIKAAEADARLRQERLAKLQQLLESDHATPEEVLRARTESDVASARLIAARESLEIRSLEYERTRIQLERRHIRSPLNGIVLKRNRNVGEFVSPNDPVVMTVVQLDPLVATFSVPAAEADKLETNQSISVQFTGSSAKVAAAIDFVSPVTEPESDTVLVKVQIPNPDGRFRSGSRLRLLLSDKPEQITRRPVR